MRAINGTRRRQQGRRACRARRAGPAACHRMVQLLFHCERQSGSTTPGTTWSLSVHGAAHKQCNTAAGPAGNVAPLWWVRQRIVRPGHPVGAPHRDWLVVATNKYLSRPEEQDTTSASLTGGRGGGGAATTPLTLVCGRPARWPAPPRCWAGAGCAWCAAKRAAGGRREPCRPLPGFRLLSMQKWQLASLWVGLYRPLKAQARAGAVAVAGLTTARFQGCSIAESRHM